MAEKKIRCPNCRRNIMFRDTVCPFCGYEMKKNRRKQVLSFIIAGILLISAGTEFYDGISTIVTDLQNTKAAGDPWYEPLRPLAFWLPQHIDTDPNSDDMAQAHQRLFNYIQVFPSSRQDLMEFLLSNDYLEEDAEAILRCFKVDYCLQARLFARDQLENGGCSRKNMEDLMESHGFTPDQIHFALNGLTMD